MTEASEKSDFREELLRRFFNPKSYFYSQFQAKLADLRRGDGPRDEDDEALRRFLDRLGGNASVWTELGSLAHIAPFQRFQQILFEAVSRLESEQMDMESMKAEIRTVAEQLAETLHSVLNTESHRTEFLIWVDLQQPAAKSSTEVETSILEELRPRRPEEPSPRRDEKTEPEPANSDPTGLPPRQRVNAAPASAAADEDELLLPFQLESEVDSEQGSPRPSPQLDEPGALDGSLTPEPPGTPEEVELEISDEEFEAWLNSLRNPADTVREEVIEEFESDADAPSLPDTASLESEPQDHGPDLAEFVEPAEAVPQTRKSQEAEPQEEEPALEDRVPSSRETSLDAEETAEALKELEAALAGENLEPSLASEELDRESVGVEVEAEAEAATEQRPTRPDVADELTQTVRMGIEDVLARLQRILAESDGRLNLKALERLMEQLRDISMMHGSEEIEEVATKTWRLVRVLARSGKGLRGSAAKLFASVHATLVQLSINRDAPPIAELIQRLARLERDPSALLEQTPPEQGHPAEAASIPSKAEESEPIKSTGPLAEGEEIHLPGEDDEELLQLIREVTQDPVSRQASPPPMLSDGAAAERVPEPKPGRAVAPEPPAAQEEENQAGPAPKPQVKPRPVPLPEAKTVHQQREPECPAELEPKVVSREVAGLRSRRVGGLLELFAGDAELYFSVFEEALSRLKQQPGQESALEDLELAASSLKGLCYKLGLDTVASLPEAVEGYAAMLISKKAPVDRDGWLAVFQSVHTLRTYAEDPTERQKTLWSLVRTIRHLTSKLESKGADPSVTEKKKVLPGSWDFLDEQERRFRLRGRRSRAGVFGY